MEIDNETAYILDPLISKFTEFNLFVVNVGTGKRGVKEYTKLYFFGGSWVEIYDNGQFECSHTDLFLFLHQAFRNGILIPPVQITEEQQGKVLVLHKE